MSPCSVAFRHGCWVFLRSVHIAFFVLTGNSRRRQQLALSRRTISLREAVVFSAQLVAEAALERTVIEQQAQLAAQQIELANAKAALSVLKEQEAQIMRRRKATGQPPMQVLHHHTLNSCNMAAASVALPLFMSAC